MKKVIFGVILAVLFTSSISYAAADIQIKVDGVTIASDVKPEIKNNRTMVPIRVISENLGVSVEWSKPEVILTKGDMEIKLTLNSATATKNGEKMKLDAKPYMKNNRVFVPLRFIAEAFGCRVNYSKNTVTVDAEPLLIDGVPVVALQHEYHMTMGGVVQQISGNAWHATIYNVFADNKGEKVKAPEAYSWMYTMDTPGSYYKEGQYDFLDQKGNSLKRYDIYTLIDAFPAELIAGFPRVLIYDVTKDEWHLFNDPARESIIQLIVTAEMNGYLKVISDTVV